MNVLHVGKFFPPPFGGMETVLLNLVEQLRRHVHVDVLVSNVSRRFEALKRDGYTVYKVPSFGSIARMSLCASMPFHLRRLFAQQQYDVVHLHFPNPMAQLSSFFLPRRVPLVLSWHSDIICQKRLLKPYRPLLNETIRRAAAIVAATPKHFSSSSQLGAVSDESRLFVVPYGVDAARFVLTDELRAEAELIRRRWPGRRLVFALGRHVHYKGFEHLIRAISHVPDAIGLLGGSGPLTPQLKNLTRRLDVQDRIHFLGLISDCRLPAFYHAAHVFCMPSIEQSEAFGLVQLEAMLARKPVVCCELNNGVTYVNQHRLTGLVVPPSDPRALAVALNQLIDDDELRHRMGNAGHRRATQLFSLRRMCEGMLNVYRHVVHKIRPLDGPVAERAA